MNRKIVIIGSGIGGLVTGYLLSKQGDHVLVLEHDKHPGGCLQSFHRDGIRFDTGFQYVGGLAEGGPLHRYFKELDLLSLPWQPLAGQEIWIGKRRFVLPTGPEKWLQYLAEQFPHQATNLQTFLQVCKEVAECPFEKTQSYWNTNAWQWLCETIKDPLLRDVLSGASMLMELNKQSLPLFPYAEIMYSYIYSSHRLVEGGQPIIDHLVKYIRSCGGDVHCSSTVTQIVEEEGKVVGVMLDDGTRVEADIVLSAIHPAKTMAMLGADTMMRKVYRQRVSQLENSIGCFTTNIQLKPGTIPMRELPVYVHREDADMWQADTPTVQHILVHFYPEQNAVDIMTPMAWRRVEKWQNTTVGNRGQEYEQLKKKWAEQCIALAETAIPGLREAIAQTWTSTPLTWKDYLLANNGTMYGVRKDYRASDTTLLVPRTPLKGLYLTGQSLILHGIMGTTISGFITTEFIKQ